MYSQAPSAAIDKNAQQQKTISKNALFFIIFSILWETAAIIIIGILFGYSDKLNVVNSTNFFLNVYILMAFFIFMVAGFTLMSAYVTYSSTTNMTFSILVALFTFQNWFIYRCFWHKTGLPLQNMSSSFTGDRYNQITYLPVDNFRIITAQYSSASFYEALGACIAMFSALTPLLGRIGFAQVFFLSWIGPFFYELNSSIFNKFFIVDTGFGMRGFLFGGMLGLFISFIIGKRPETKEGNRFMSHYHINALALIGAVIVCLTYPNVVSAGLLVRDGVINTIAGVAQINSWFSLGGSIVGVYTANSLMYRKLHIHDVIFTSLSGAIAYSCSASINYNPGAAMAIGSGVGFMCALMHTPFKRWINEGGVRESNSVIVQFIIPGIFACVMSSIMQAIDQSSFQFTFDSSASPATQTLINRDSGRGPSGQAGWQLMGFAFSLGCALICSVILGIIMRIFHNDKTYSYFNDLRFIQYGSGNQRMSKYREE